jgi:hypothetical protein
MSNILQSLRANATALLSDKSSTMKLDCIGLDFEIGQMSTLKAMTAEGLQESCCPRRAEILTAMIGTNR